MPTIKVRKTKSHDWAEVYVDDELYFEGHSIPDDIWIQLLENEGVEVHEEEYDDEDEEE